MFLGRLGLNHLEVLIAIPSTGRHVQQGLGPLTKTLDEVGRSRAVRDLKSGLFKIGQHGFSELLSRHGHDVLLTQPKQLFRIERRRRLIHAGDVEQLHHFLDGKYLLVPVRPAKPHQVVQQRLRKIPLLSVLTDVYRPVTLRELGPVGAQDHRQMGVIRRLNPQRRQHVHLPGRIVQMIVTANDVRDVHV